MTDVNARQPKKSPPRGLAPPQVPVWPERDAAARVVFLDYAAFVLDQEARYCQQ